MTTTKVILKGQLTKREILLIEEESGIAITDVGNVLTDPHRPKMRLAAVMTLVALRRTRPDAKLDDVLDGDFELDWQVDDSPLPGAPVSGA